MRRPSLKTVLRLSALLFSLYVFSFWRQDTRAIPPTPLNLSHVIVHLDLKGAPPRLSYLTSLLPLLKRHGATGLLLEYEDMFPYEAELRNISAGNSYDKPELVRFVQRATSLQLELIPLVQTFGHLEHALKLRQFEHLREDKAYPDSICPSSAESLSLVSRMLDQVLNFHAGLHDLNFVHIGCDEVFHINSCQNCRRKNLSKGEIFLDHVIAVREELRKKHPKTTVLIWDDMVRSIPPLLLQKYNIPSGIEIVVWDYKPQIDITHAVMFKYYKYFGNIWIASAFKGADKKGTLVPNILNRYKNHYSWLEFINTYYMPGNKDIYKFRGIIITGWSRFSHLDPLCEILPVSIPSLVTCLITVKHFKKEVVQIDKSELENIAFQKLHVVINCRKAESIVIERDCTFDEVDVYDNFVKLNSTMSNISNYLTEINFVNADFTEFEIKHKHVNPVAIYEIESKFNVVKQNLEKIEAYAATSLNEYFDPHVVAEIVESQKCVKNIVLEVLKRAQDCRKVNVWEPGPLV